jgi:hypothetical protein
VRHRVVVLVDLDVVVEPDAAFRAIDKHRYAAGAKVSAAGKMQPSPASIKNFEISFVINGLRTSPFLVP